MSAVAEPIFAGRFDQAVCWRGAVFPVGRLDAIRGRGGAGEAGEFRQAAPRGPTPEAGERERRSGKPQL